MGMVKKGEDDGSNGNGNNASQLIAKLIKHILHDNLHLLHNIRLRMERGCVAFPAVEVRYKQLRVAAECEVVKGKPLPTLWNSIGSITWGVASILGFNSREAHINIIDDVSGVIKPGRYKYNEDK